MSLDMLFVTEMNVSPLICVKTIAVMDLWKLLLTIASHPTSFGIADKRKG
jgi:hypothetical protein